MRSLGEGWGLGTSQVNLTLSITLTGVRVVHFLEAADQRSGSGIVVVHMAINGFVPWPRGWECIGVQKEAGGGQTHLPQIVRVSRGGSVGAALPR